MIEKRILVAKSSYFAALLNGPLAKPLEEDKSLHIDEANSDTFKNLIYLLREGNVADAAMIDSPRLARLKEMALFLFKIHTYVSLESHFKNYVQAI